MLIRILMTLAGLMAAAGVALAAVAVHARPGVGLDSASLLLLIHGPAILAVSAALAQGLLAPRIGFIAATGMVLGAVLFAGDVSLRAYAGTRIFPYAAPTGGTTLVLSWLLLALAALTARRDRIL